MNNKQDKCLQYIKPENKDLNFKLRPRQDLCIHRFDEYGTTNGMLLMHNVGSGKTLTSLTLAINSIDWEVKGDKIILIVHPTGLFDEFSSEIATKILNIESINIKGNTKCETDSENGIRRYKFKKNSEFKNRGGNWQPNPTDPVFFIESIQYNELARFFNKYDESVLKIRDIFKNKIVIIDEAHRLFRQFDVCDKSSMIINKYINDGLMAGAKKIIAMTGTPIKNSIKDMFSLFKFINIANITNIDENVAIYLQDEYKKFDLTNTLTFKKFKKSRVKTIDPSLFSGIKCAYTRMAMAFYDFYRRDRTDASEKYPIFTNSYIRDCAKINYDAEKKGNILDFFKYVTLLIADTIGYGTPTSINKVFIEQANNIKKNINGDTPQRRRGGKKSKTKKFRGGTISTKNEAKQILMIGSDVPDSSLKKIAKEQYRKLALKYHPDKIKLTGNKETDKKMQDDSNNKFASITEAYYYILNEKTDEEVPTEDLKIENYYSKVVESTFLQVFLTWTEEEMIGFRKNMEYILLNIDFTNFSLYDFLVEFSTTNPFNYIDLLSEDIEDIKNVSLEDVKCIIQNYENENSNYYKLYFKMDYDLFNNLYVNSQPLQFIEDYKNNETVEPDETVKPDEKDEQQNNNEPDKQSSIESSASAPYNQYDWTAEESDERNRNEEMEEEQSQQKKKSGFSKYFGFGGNDLDNDYTDFIIPNEMEYSSFWNKIKNEKDNTKLQEIIGEISQESIQIIQSNTEKITQITNEMKPVIQELITNITNSIENSKQTKLIEQKGGMPILAVLLVLPKILKSMGISIDPFLSSLKSIANFWGAPEGTVEFLISIFKFCTNMPEFIGECISSFIKNPLDALKNFKQLYSLLNSLKDLINLLPKKEVIFGFFQIIIKPLLDYKYYIGGLIVFFGANKFLNWYLYSTSIYSLDKNTWFKSLFKRFHAVLRKTSKFFSLYRSTPDELTMLNIAEQSNWIRKRNRLKQKLYKDNAFFEFDYDMLFELSDPLVSTITVTMPSINSDVYNKFLNTNLYAIETMYKNNKDLLFVNEEFLGYPNRDTFAINFVYDTYQYYSFNQFKNILKISENNKYIDYINNYIPWYLNKKLLLDTKVIGNLSKDVSYPLSSFIDNTRPIVYYDIPTDSYKLNVSNGKIQLNKLNLSPDSGITKPFYNADEISFSCDKFEKILNYLILMKTGYMVDLSNNEFNIIPQPHLSSREINVNNILNVAENPDLYQKVHTIDRNTTQSFLPFVYSTSDELGLNLFAYFLNKRGYTCKILHELSPNESAVKNDTLKKTYPIINLENNPDGKRLLSDFFIKNIVHSFNDKTFEETYSQVLKREPICVLLHPFKTEGIDAKYNPAIFLLEPPLNFGDYEQLCGRVLRTYHGQANYRIKPKKMVYQCLCSSRSSLEKFYNNYSFLQEKLEIVEEDSFSVENFFNIAKKLTVADPYYGYALRNSWAYLIPDIPIIGKFITKPLKENLKTSPTATKVKIDALVPNIILENILFSSINDEILNFQKNITNTNNIDDNSLNYIKKNIGDLDNSLKDLVEGIEKQKDEDILTSTKKSHFDFYNLIDEFIGKANNVLLIHSNYGPSSAFKILRKQLENAFGPQEDIFKKTIRRAGVFDSRFKVFTELASKCNKYEYSKLIMTDIMKYIGGFKENDMQTYNVSVLLELTKLLKIIPNIDDIDTDFVDIGSDIYDFLSIKRTEFMFKKIVTARYERNVNEQNTKIIPDLESIINNVNMIDNEQLQEQIKYMPWCDTISKRKHSRCNTTQSFLSGTRKYDFTNTLTQIKDITNSIIQNIINNQPIETLNGLKSQLDVLYSNSYTQEPVEQQAVAPVVEQADEQALANPVVPVVPVAPQVVEPVAPVVEPVATGGAVENIVSSELSNKKNKKTRKTGRGGKKGTIKKK
jgi:hypothetical protein